MIQTHVTYHACFNLQFLDICLVENLEPRLYLVRSQNIKSVKHPYCSLLVIYLKSLRHIAYRPQSSRLCLLLPLLTVSVTLEHYVAGFRKELSNHGHDSCRTAFARIFQSENSIMELIETFSHYRVQHKDSRSHILRRTDRTELETVTGKRKWRSSVPVGIVRKNFRNRVNYLYGLQRVSLRLIYRAHIQYRFEDSIKSRA